MKRLLLVCAVVLLSCMTLADVYAQSLRVKIEAMSPGRRSSGSPNYTAPTGPNYVSTGLKVVAKGMKVYFSADTTGSGANVVSSFAWSFKSMPVGSNAVFDSPANSSVSFVSDSTGPYVVQVVAGGKTVTEKVFASTYVGSSTTKDCGICHAPWTPAKANWNSWKTSAHATIFTRGVTGQLENDPAMGYKGAYASSCAKCHTTGWENVTDNGNFGSLAKKSGWDTTWYKGLPLANGDYWVTSQDQSIYNAMPANLQALGTIGCETCHGPAGQHIITADTQYVDSKTTGAGVCLQCHDAPKKHRLGSYWQASAHSNLKLSAAEASRSSCYPCHNGDAFIKFANAYNQGKSTLTPADSAKITVLASITCASCHDPHGSSNEKLLRIAKRDTLSNGYRIPVGMGGKGQLCMNCHRSRDNNNVKVQVPNQMKRIADRFYPHYAPQADMYVGSNAWEYNLPLSGLNTHGGVKDGCVTCHMSERVNGSSVHADHEMSMMVTDVNGLVKPKVEGCKDCHGEIEDFNDIKAALDYDGNGKIEGVQTEVQGLLDKLKAKLPTGVSPEDGTNDVIWWASDSAKVKSWPGYPSFIPAVFNYYFVKRDGSLGVHNTKYAIAILRASLGLVTGVTMDPVSVPTAFELSQNYPNPFNPTTEIRFALPKASNVKLVVYDIIGRVVKTLVDQRLDAGGHRAMWSGRDESGKTVASGVYFYHIQADGFNATKKMVLTK